MPVDLSTSVAGLRLECCVYNASGPKTHTHTMLGKIAASAAGAVLSKSATLVKQDGNPLPRYQELVLSDDRCPGSINSEGLPNKGIDYYIESDHVANIRKTGKPYIVSLSGKTLEDNLEMFDRACRVEGISAIELNLACPNVVGHPIIGYDFDQMESVLQAVTAHPAFGTKPLGIKLPVSI